MWFEKMSVFTTIYPENCQCLEALQKTTCSIASFKFLLYLKNKHRSTGSACSTYLAHAIATHQQKLCETVIQNDIYFLPYLLWTDLFCPLSCLIVAPFSSETQNSGPLLLPWVFQDNSKIHLAFYISNWGQRS